MIRWCGFISMRLYNFLNKSYIIQLNAHLFYESLASDWMT